MIIDYRCPCGASFSCKDDSGTFINEGGGKDDKGRILVIEVKADDWLELHSKMFNV